MHLSNAARFACTQCVCLSVFIFFFYRILVGKQLEKRSLGRPRRRWKDGIKMDLRGIGGGDDR
jgi:hypothetical protein